MEQDLGTFYLTLYILWGSFLIDTLHISHPGWQDQTTVHGRNYKSPLQLSSIHPGPLTSKPYLLQTLLALPKDAMEQHGDLVREVEGLDNSIAAQSVVESEPVV